MISFREAIDMDWSRIADAIILQEHKRLRDEGRGSLHLVEEESMASREAVGNNAEQQGFTSGATRSTDAWKIDYEGHLHPDVLMVFADYMNQHRVQRDGRTRASDNWQEGIPVYRYVKSFIRHAFEFWRMWRGTPVMNPDNRMFFTFRDVLSALLFNAMGIIFELGRKGNKILPRPGSERVAGYLLPWLDRTCITKTERQAFEQEDQ